MVLNDCKGIQMALGALRAEQQQFGPADVVCVPLVAV